MKFVFFDTEFTDFSDPKIMSIGCVDESGDKIFYAETYDSWKMKDCSSFVISDVITLFSNGHFSMSMKEAASKLADWANGFDEPVGFVTDSPSWDWKMLVSLFHRTGTKFPENIVSHHFWLHEVYPELNDIPMEDWDEAMSSKWPQGYRKHHALDDAMVNRLRWFDGHAAVEDPVLGTEFKMAPHPSETLKKSDISI